MIFNTVQEIMRCKSVSLKGGLLEDLTDEFRSGRSAWELLELISTEDKNYISVATYILGEIIIEEQALIDMIVIRLHELLEFEDSQIRHRVFLLLSQYLKEQGLNLEKELYVKMQYDDDKGIQEVAKTLLNNDQL